MKQLWLLYRYFEIHYMTLIMWFSLRLLITGIVMILVEGATLDSGVAVNNYQPALGGGLIIVALLGIQGFLRKCCYGSLLFCGLLICYHVANLSFAVLQQNFTSITLYLNAVECVMVVWVLFRVQMDLCDKRITHAKPK